MTNKTEEVTTEVTPDATPDTNVQISIEQICASIIKTLGSVEVSLEDLVTDYSNKSIAVNQNEETKALTFTLADAPAPVEEEAVVEETPAESE
jgi:hypothetical protein